MEELFSDNIVIQRLLNLHFGNQGIDRLNDRVQSRSGLFQIRNQTTATPYTFTVRGPFADVESQLGPFNGRVLANSGNSPRIYRTMSDDP
jgi:hypothetical protein